MKIKLLILMTVLLSVSQILAQDCKTPKGWHFKLCLKKTESEGAFVKYRIGGCDEGDCPVYENYLKKDGVSEIAMPIEIRYVREMWMQVTTLNNDKNVRVCLYFNDTHIREFDCDGNPETHDSEFDKPRKCHCN